MLKLCRDGEYLETSSSHTFSSHLDLALHCQLPCCVSGLVCPCSLRRELPFSGGRKMGRAREWLGILLHCGKCSKEEKNDDSVNLPREKKGKKSASFGNRAWYKSSNSNANNETEQSKHALTAVTAAVRIQSFFRGHLARKALRALRSLVQLQSLIRGYLARKITVAAALQRAAAAVRPHSGGRRTSSFQKSLENGSSEKKTPFFFQRLPASFDSSNSPLEYSPKIMDTFRPSMIYSPRIHHYSMGKCLRCSNAAHNSPRFLKPACTAPATPATPTKLGPEECRRLLSCPSYMASTQSFTAKTRPQSAPRQRGDTTTWMTSAPAVIEAVRSSCSRIPEGVRLRSAVMKMIVEREAGMLNW